MTEPAIAAATYARWRSTTRGAITEAVETRVVFELAGPLRAKRVLDVGTGDGTYALEAAARGAVVTGIDSESEMLDAACRRAAGRGTSVAFVRGRAEALPFGDASFDVILAVTVLCFVPDADRAVREMARVLAPGGRVVVGELARCSVWAVARRVRAWLGAKTWSSARFWTGAGLADLVRRAGLRVVATRGSIFFPPSRTAARVLVPLEPLLTRAGAPGAAFLALLAEKSENGPP